MNVYGNLAFQEGPREEIIGGRVRLMAAATVNHNRVAGNIFTIFQNYLRKKPCEPFSNGTDLFLDEDREEYKPDMMVVCDPEKVRRKGIYGAPDLVVEVLSKSTARHDRGHKMTVYERHGVREYWIADPENRSLEQYVLDNGKFVLRDVYHQYTKEDLDDMKESEREAVVTEFSCSLFDDLTIRVEDIFARVIPGL